MTAKLTAERLRSLLHYEPVTGIFTWLVSRHCVPAGAIAGSVHKQKGYVNVRVDLRLYRAHRLAWLWVHGNFPSGEIDHINGIKTDNRFCNLRDVSRRTNAENLRAATAKNTCGFLGVTRRNGRYEARISARGNAVYLGRHSTPEAAHAAHIQAKRLLHAGCAV